MSPRSPLFALLLSSLAPLAAQTPTGLPPNSKVGPLALGNLRVLGNENRLSDVPPGLLGKPSLTVERGDGKKPAPPYTVTLDEETRVYLFVHQRGTPAIPPSWTATGVQVTWKNPGLVEQKDDVYVYLAPKGTLTIPGHDGKDGAGYHGLPHVVVFAPPTLSPIRAGGPTAPSATPEAKPNAAASLVSLKTSLGNVLAPASLGPYLITLSGGKFRVAGGLKISQIPKGLEGLEALGMPRGDGSKPAPAYTLVLPKDMFVYLFVHDRGGFTPGSGWTATPGKSVFSPDEKIQMSDRVYFRKASKGDLLIPGHEGKEGPNHGIPHLVVFSETQVTLP